MVMKIASFFPPVSVFASKWQMAFSSGEHVRVVFDKEYCIDVDEIQLHENPWSQRNSNKDFKRNKMI